MDRNKVLVVRKQVVNRNPDSDSDRSENVKDSNSNEDVVDGYVGPYFIFLPHQRLSGLYRVGPDFNKLYFKHAAVVKGPEECNLRIGERQGQQACCLLRWSIRIVCQKLNDGVEQEDWESMYHKLRESGKKVALVRTQELESHFSRTLEWPSQNKTQKRNVL